MSTGTEIIQDAMTEIKAHSVMREANPESLQSGKNVLNSMIAAWEDKGIKMGCVPLKVVGSELSEPRGARNAIVLNLAILLAPKFPGSQLSPLLISNAAKTLKDLEDVWNIPTIPNKVLNSSFPRGQGNKDYGFSDDVFFNEGDEISG